MKVIILAGGSGTRLWPLSRGRYPKQFIKIQGKKHSLFQDAFLRGRYLTEVDEIFVVTSKKYKFLVMGAVKELGIEYNEDNIIVEPEARNTLPAIFAGLHFADTNHSDHVLVLSSDHLMLDDQNFASVIQSSLDLADNKVVTFGIKPTDANTGYGYISPGKPVMNGFDVLAFKEKPNADLANEYIENGYLWNSGIFLFSSKVFAGEVKTYEKEIYDAFVASDSIEEAFSKFDRRISIDYGILERTDKVVVVPLDIEWSDLGTFDAFYDAFKKDGRGNVSDNRHYLIDSKNNFVHSEGDKLIATIGVDDLLIVDNRDALLICKKEESQKVREVVKQLEADQDRRLEYNVQDYRPWGDYKILEEEKTYKIKHINIGVGQKVSYQLHHHRSEHWIIVSGMAKVTIDDVVQFVSSGESIFIRPGQKHRLENPGKIPLQVIEVQMGDYLEEDDIIRFEDDYGRK
jgi:mannose-1-phosphate guanylyltransferase/mannose-6-phosphate isomerase